MTAAALEPVGAGSTTDDVHETAPDLSDLHVEEVDNDGRVILRFPGGWSMVFYISAELISSYRRLIRH